MQTADEFGIAYDSSVRSPPKPVRREKSPMQILEEAKAKTYQVLYALKDFLIKRLGSLLEHTT